MFSWPVRKSSPIDSSIRLTFYRLSIRPTFDLIHFNQLPFSNQNCAGNMLQTNQSNILFLIRFVVLLISWLQGHTELSTALDIVPKQAYSETDQIIFFTLHFDNFDWSQSQNNFENYLVGLKYKD